MAFYNRLHTQTQECVQGALRIGRRTDNSPETLFIPRIFKQRMRMLNVYLKIT